ncbi:amidohydrolase family protein [Agathobaculum sp.]|uniref:amidohydrolase family protein n=1 Tax=Agathobaculum sp. TaxID=2048138 RepID=UPI002A801E39|nr:amidohydrolase [Agathobaculum sp.]MDY3617938.1 amidohydrolase [Agathobaculum sp.]
MLFCNIDLLDEHLNWKRGQYVGVRNDTIEYIGSTEPSADYGERYDGRHRLLLPGFYNVHSHAPMTMLRGYAENLPLDRWLNEKVFPFEDQLTAKYVYYGTQLAIAEMLQCGTVSFTDMYFECQAMAKAVLESGIKCNLSRGLTVFDDSAYDEQLPAYRDNMDLIGNYHNAGEGKLQVDLCIHGEYTSTPKIVDAVAAQAKEYGLRMHIHLSETQAEHEACKQRYGLTPAAYMESHGVFDVPTTAAHCVWLEDGDFDILKRHGVTVACCPASNLKLASGYANVPEMMRQGIAVALGTDGAASNNNLNILKDLYLFAIAYKGYYHDSTLITPQEALYAATRAGACSQGRKDSGLLKVGCRADLCVLDVDTPQFTPMTDAACNVVYAAQGTDIRLTMVDGKVLYRDGEYLTLDIERVKYEAQQGTQEILTSL